MLIVILIVCFRMRYDFVYVLSASMKPSLEVGAVTLVDKGDKNLERGDIAVYRHYGRNIIHRVSDVTSAGYIFKGDANSSTDPGTAKKSQIKGKVKAVFNAPAPLVRRILNLQDI